MFDWVLYAPLEPIRFHALYPFLLKGKTILLNHGKVTQNVLFSLLGLGPNFSLYTGL